MDKVDNLKLGTKFLFITKQNHEFKGILVDRDTSYVYVKDVKFGAKFSSLYVFPISELARVS